MGRPKGSVNLLTKEAREQMQMFVKGVSQRELKSLWARVKRTKPEQALTTYVAILKHFVPPAKEAEPGSSSDKPLVVEVRERSVGGGADPHQSEVASAAAALQRHGYESGRGSDDDED